MIPKLSAFQPESFLSARDNLEFILRIGIATILGMVVGMERSARSKEAGIRTHCIVAMTASVFMVLSKYAFMDLVVDGSLGIRGGDPARIAAQVVSGISFLGAGIIFKNGHNTVKGLTTAAGMWATAGIGMAVGAGLYWVGISATVLVLVTQIVFHHLPSYVSQSEQHIYLRSLYQEEVLSDFHTLLVEHNCIIDSSSIHREQGEIEMHLTLRATHAIDHKEVLDFMSTHAGVREMDVES